MKKTIAAIASSAALLIALAGCTGAASDATTGFYLTDARVDATASEVSVNLGCKENKESWDYTAKGAKVEEKSNKVAKADPQTQSKDETGSSGPTDAPYVQTYKFSSSEKGEATLTFTKKDDSETVTVHINSDGGKITKVEAKGSDGSGGSAEL